MIEMTWGGKKIEVTTFEFDTISDATEAFAGLEHAAIEGSITVNLVSTFYQLNWLADRIAPQNPKKAKHLRRMAYRHNPLRILGLL